MPIRAAIFSILAAFGVGVVLARGRTVNNEVTILTFHRISDKPDVLWPAMPVKVFTKLMGFLAQNANVVDILDLPHLKEKPKKPIFCISFDDGYSDFIENALPVLNRWRLPCHHNICPGLIDSGELPWVYYVSEYMKKHLGSELTFPDGRQMRLPHELGESDYIEVLSALYTLEHSERMEYVLRLRKDLSPEHVSELMTWDQIRVCQAAGVRFGSHSLSHAHLPTIRDQRVLIDEIQGSRLRIADELGEEPALFAFPSGFYDDRCLQLVRASGYRFALLCEDQVFRIPLTNIDETFHTLTRLNLTDKSYSEEKLRSLGFHERVKRLFRTYATY